MKRINQVAWMVLAGLSFLVGTWVLITEGVVHSKFFVFYGFSLICALGFYIKRKSFLKNAKPKKRL
jgi:hypothetical protein